MTLTASNIVMPGPALIYIAAHSTSALEAAPASSIAKGTAWAGNWVEVGFTAGGVVLKPEVEHLEVEVDQANAPVTDFIIKQNATISFAVAEATLTQIKQALGYGTITTGSTESSLGVSATDGFPTYYSVGFEQFAPSATSASAKYRRLFGWKCLMTEGPELKAEKSENQLVSYVAKCRYEPQASGATLWKMIDRQN